MNLVQATEALRNQDRGRETNLIRNFAAIWLVRELCKGKPQGIAVLDYLQGVIDITNPDLGYPDEIPPKLEAWFMDLQEWLSAWSRFSGEDFSLSCLKDLLEASVTWHAQELLNELKDSKAAN